MAPPLAEGFVIRAETVPGLEAGLVSGAVVALVPGEGARACGKTQLAAYLAESLRRSGEADLVAWVAADSRASVLSGYRQAAAALGLDHGGDAEGVAARFLAWLAAAGRPWLVVLDDMRDAADLDGLMPAGSGGRVLVTAADTATVADVPRVGVFAVPAFSTREALNYLSGRLSADPDQRSGAIDLAGELGGEPTALAQAAAVILSSGIRCSEYRQTFARRRAQIAPGADLLPAAAVLAFGSRWRRFRSESVAVRLIPFAIVMAVGSAIACLGYQQFVTNLTNFLDVLLVLFIPWSAVNLADYFIIRRGSYDVASFFTADGEYGRFAWRGLLAYAIGLAAEWPFVAQPDYTGPLVKILGGADISWLAGWFAAALAYLLLVALTRSSPRHDRLAVAGARRY